ncbi:MAG: 50S ribosomal protein L9 [Cytophagales bacterium]|nr:50S ribosomal protein L9 [Cytophagales bacterium]
MEIILKKDIQGLGFVNDLVSVKPGYGRNYLIPQGFAIIANETNKKILAENLKQAAHKAEKVKAEAEDKAAKIASASIKIATKVGETGRIFGAVTTLQLSDALKEQGIDIDRKQISIKADVKEIGTYTANIALHKEVSAEASFEVVAE